MDDGDELVPRGEIAQPPRVEQSRDVAIGTRQVGLSVPMVKAALPGVNR
jgi:hypothetical protein